MQAPRRRLLASGSFSYEGLLLNELCVAAFALLELEVLSGSVA